MSLVWPEYKVALEIVDDPLAQRFDRESHPDYEVIETTMAEVMDQDACYELGVRLSKALGCEPVERTPEWNAANKRLMDSTNSWVRQFYPGL